MGAVWWVVARMKVKRLRQSIAWTLARSSTERVAQFTPKGTDRLGLETLVDGERGEEMSAIASVYRSQKKWKRIIIAGWAGVS